jgi:DNA mismatch endonuclease, patch repair protein
MSRIRSRDTAPERVVRQMLHRLGFRFRLSSSQRVLGKPDIVLPKYRTIVFVHGCFWHRHSHCKFCYMPKSRVEFWQQKFAANKARDEKVRRQLGREGWRVHVIWECQIAKTGYLERQFATIGEDMVPKSPVRTPPTSKS